MFQQPLQTYLQFSIEYVRTHNISVNIITTCFLNTQLVKCENDTKKLKIIIYATPRIKFRPKFTFYNEIARN